MVLVRPFLLLLLPLLLYSCQLGYLWHVSYNHLAMLNSKEPVEQILKSDRITAAQKQKIELSQEVRQFCFDKLKLYRSKNYSEFVNLKRDYVTYTVSASQKWKLEPYLWSFPIIGKAPYKGFYDEALAKQEAEEMKSQDLDVSIRGVSAFSTLGKLTDPLYSSMLNYSDHHLVNTIIHELVHTTLFIKDNVDFNERLAVFVANKGTELFYLDKEGANSQTLQKIKDENRDDQEFSKFIGHELESLKKWYEDFDHSKSLPPDEKEKIRLDRLELIARHFETELKPQLKTGYYNRVFNKKFNNADLNMQGTYMKDLNVFEAVYRKAGSDIPSFLSKCQQLKNVDDPEKELERWAQ